MLFSGKSQGPAGPVRCTDGLGIKSARPSDPTAGHRANRMHGLSGQNQT